MNAAVAEHQEKIPTQKQAQEAKQETHPDSDPHLQPSMITVPDSKSRNIPVVVIVRRGAVGVLGIRRGWVSWVKGGANGASLQATWGRGGQFLSQLEGAK